MFEFKPFSVEVMEQGFSTVLIDYPSFEQAESKAKMFTSKCPDRMINIIAWDTSKRHSIDEWALVRQRYMKHYDPSLTLH